MSMTDWPLELTVATGCYGDHDRRTSKYLSIDIACWKSMQNIELAKRLSTELRLDRDSF